MLFVFQNSQFKAGVEEGRRGAGECSQVIESRRCGIMQPSTLPGYTGHILATTEVMTMKKWRTIFLEDPKTPTL